MATKNQLKLKKIMERAEKATPGNWSNSCCGGHCPAGIMSTHHPICNVISGGWGDEYPTIEFENGEKLGLSESTEFKVFDRPVRATVDGLDYGSVEKFQAKANGDFIAHSRQDIPFLLSLVEKYQRALERIKECVGGDDPSNGMKAPEDVWGIVNEVLSEEALDTK